MSKYIFVRSPLKAAQLLEKGFSYVKAPVARDQTVFIFEDSGDLRDYLSANFSAADYSVSNQALICF